jgi:RimJ/RimL family protein N-acetyltransferase
MVDDGLYVPLADGHLRLDILAEEHREGLRAACAEDPDIWEIYPFSYLGDVFDPQFDWMLEGPPQRRCYAIVEGGEVVGMTAWIGYGDAGWSIEIGNSYIVPRLRGSGLNRRFKRLMLDHAFACGLERAVFKVDSINARSRAAVLKLGCMQEGILRHERRTWTGRVRDTVTFSILKHEWNGTDHE